MQAEESLHQGQPEEALAQLQTRVRNEPGNPKLRIFLFQLLAVLGRWERALTQLNVVGELDNSSLLMVQTYREAIQCEVLREAVFAGRRTPLLFGEPEQWVALLVEALRLEGEGHVSEALALRQQALELAPTTAGSINGICFDWIADADTRLGPTVEAIVNGRYYWIPFQQISHIDIEEPVDLRDVVWIPAVFTWRNGGQATGLIPTRYPGSEQAEDGLIRLARKTDWQTFAPGAYRGLGQRLFATNDDDYALLDVRSIALNSSDGPA